MLGDNWNNKGVIHIIDFGLATKWKDPETGVHRPAEEGVTACGTWRYDSIHSMKHTTTSRRDDMISFMYMLLYFARGGNLPWMGLQKQIAKNDGDSAA